jgi:hypothetical protein
MGREHDGRPVCGSGRKNSAAVDRDFSVASYSLCQMSRQGELGSVVLVESVIAGGPPDGLSLIPDADGSPVCPGRISRIRREASFERY